MVFSRTPADSGSAPHARSRARDRALALAAVVAGAGLLAFQGWWLGSGLVDDAYIFLRYADNIAQGLGITFNPGERVEGFSSPAWMLLLAAARILSAPPEAAALALGAAASLGIAVAVASVLAQAAHPSDDRRVRVLLAAGLLTLPAVVVWSFSGMDHPLFSLLVTAALASALNEAPRGVVSTRTALVLAAAMIARPEGVLLAAWICGYATFAHGRLDRQWLAGVAAPLARACVAPALLTGARYLYFGSLVPNTYYAKVTPDTAERLTRGTLYVLRGLLAHLPLFALGAFLALLARRRRAFPFEAVQILGGWIVLWMLYVLYEGGDHFGMFRFFLPALPALVILLGILWQAACRQVATRMRVGVSIVVAIAFAASNVASVALDGSRARLEPALSRSWAEAGRWIARHTPLDTLVATNVIGAIGYFSRRPIVDMVGLVDPIVARQGQVYRAAAAGHGRYDTDYVYSRSPDLVVYPTAGRLRQPWPVRPLEPPVHFAIIDFAGDPRRTERYVHVFVPLPDGTWIEMLRKRGFIIPGLDTVVVDDDAAQAPGLQ